MTVDAATVQATRSLRDEALDQDARKLLAAHKRRKHTLTAARYREHAAWVTSTWERAVWRRAADLTEQEASDA